MTTTVPLAIHPELESFLGQELQKELLRFTTAGSVDDGKSTLIGRLLHDCKAVYEDQLDSVKKSRINRSGRTVDFSLLTDGLRAEREQGITIDVAYRYFSTPRRKFIIADTPGHEQYTRNMATGASTADLAVVLIDATKGLLPQTRRHAYITALLGIDRVLGAVNKMDLINYQEDVFRHLEREFSQFARALGISSVRCVPISALDGDNVATPSHNTPWYTGPTLLGHLETVPIHGADQTKGLRFPVQSVIRPNATFRGYAGRVASGRVHLGDEILVLPSRRRTHVESIVSFDGELPSVEAGESTVLKLADEIDISRGDLLVSPDAEPRVSNRFSAMVVWLHAMPLELNRTYLAKHTSRQVKAKATRIRYRVDVNELTDRQQQSGATSREHPADQLEMNEIALVDFETNQPLYFDSYRSNRATGSLILIDPLSNATVGAVMIRDDLTGGSEGRNLADVEGTAVRGKLSVLGKLSLEERIQHRGHRPAILLIQSERALAEALERELLDRGFESAFVNCQEISSAAWPVLFPALWQLGLVVIAWAGNPIRPRQRGILAEIAGNSLFELASAKEQASTADIRNQVIRTAETLRNEKEFGRRQEK
jgi:sulfate adenylyltransferase subunit 1